MDSIEAYTAFARMMELGSFSAVGRQLGVSQSTVSKHIAALEAEFRVQLFVRTTRKISPTIEAIELQEHVQRLLEQVEAVRAVARGQRPEARGLLRVALPNSFARCRIMPLLPAFLDRYPLITVEVILTDSEPDLVREGFELAVAIGEPTTPSLVTRSLRVFERVVVAAPSYLARRGTPQMPSDLDHHDLIVSTGTGSGRVVFDSEDGRQVIDLAARLRTNSDEAAFDAAVAGHGIAIVPSWLLAGDGVPAVRLLLPEYSLPAIPVFVTDPQTRFLSRRARLFIDFLVQEIARDGKIGAESGAR